TPADTAKAMLTEARAGASVVRLVTGDVFIDDHAVREALAVARTVVPFDIVPGLSIAAGTAAYAGMPVGFVHSEADLRQMEAADFDLLARSPGTLRLTVPADQVIYVGAQLVSCGLKPDTPVTLTSDGTGTGQHTATATAGERHPAGRSTTGAPPAS